MTNSQYIEVAEKVWGWNPIPLDSQNWTTSKGLDTRFLRHLSSRWNIEDEVNSWQGFGRTVEAMAKNWGPHDVGPMQILIAKFKDNLARFILNQQDVDELIEATHLAALEAIDDKL